MKHLDKSKLTVSTLLLFSILLNSWEVWQMVTEENLASSGYIVIFVLLVLIYKKENDVLKLKL